MTAATPRTIAPSTAFRPIWGRALPSPLEQRLARARRSVATTPGLLRLALGIIWALGALTLLAAYHGIAAHQHEMQAVAKDSAPSIVAAQEIRASLAAMQVDVARQLLDNPVAAQADRVAYEQRRQSAARALVTAAENITYGDAERVPIRTLVFASGTFEHDVARAVALHEHHNSGDLDPVRDAEQVLHEQLLPAADALDKANYDALTEAYGSERFSSGLATVLFVVAAVTLLASLIAVQVLLRRRMRRVFNLPLAGASLLLVWLLAALVSGFLAESRELKIVKEDCFDSIHALSRAKAYAYDARGYQLLGLLDPTRAGVLNPGFAQNSGKLLTLDAGETLQSVTRDAEVGGTANGFSGYLADELHNITFNGEREKAVATLRGYADYLASSNVAGRLSAAGDSHAVEVALSDSPQVQPGDGSGNDSIHGCAYAFGQFDAALDGTLAINQREFDAAFARGQASLEGRLAASCMAMAAVALLAYAGLRPRLKEYAG